MFAFDARRVVRTRITTHQMAEEPVEDVFARVMNRRLEAQMSFFMPEGIEPKVQ